MVARGMRTTWDALASAVEVYVGDPARGKDELESLFGRLGADPRGGTCVEVGCGPGRMTVHLAERFEKVVALDVSRAMVEQARTEMAARRLANVTVELVSGEGLEAVPSASADTLVCYLVLQHLPRRRLVTRYLLEFARVLSPGGEAFVQLPVLRSTLGGRARRAMRSFAVPLVARATRTPTRQAAFRGVRLTDGELERALRAAGLHTLRRDENQLAPYRGSRDVFLRLAHT